MPRMIYQMLPLLLAALTLGLIAQPAAAQQDDIADLPISRAVLYSSGVGYFEHIGTIEGDKTVRLQFKTDQINDVLKSMVVLDLDGGTASRVVYPSQDPIERALQSYSIDLSGTPTLPELLRQMRGAVVTVHAPNPITGRILNVEARTSVKDDTETTVYHLQLVTDDGLRSLPLDSVNSVQLQDAELQEELNKALSLIASSRDKDSKPVDIHFRGEGKRRVLIGYLVETPVWKTSYRLDLSAGEARRGRRAAEGAEGAKNQTGLLQGWAIVENTSGNDWHDIGLSLVSGRPISFRMDLYTPLYLDRPLVEPELYQSLRPQVYDDGVDSDRRTREARMEVQEESMRRGQAGKAAGRAMMADSYAPSAAAAEPSSMSLNQSAAESVATAGDLGELFQYTIDEKVSLDRRTSAMLPILNQEVEAEKVSIYNQSAMPRHPLHGALLTNSSDLKLMAGPITVFEDGAYAGDARIDHMTPGETRMLSYAVDLGVTVDTGNRSTSNITQVRIVKGVLHVTRSTEYSQTYTIDNKTDRARTMIVEHPRHHGRKLVEPSEPMETAPNVLRFRVPVKADSVKEFTVVEEQTHTQTIALLNVHENNFLWYARNNEIPKDVREALIKAAQMKQSINELQQTMQQKQRDLNNIQQGQDRLRQNIQTVGANSQLGQRYIQKLANEEDQIEKLQREINDLQQRINKEQNALADYLNDLNVR